MSRPSKYQQQNCRQPLRSGWLEYKPLEAKDGFDEVTNDIAENDANPFAAASTKAVATTEDALGG